MEHWIRSWGHAFTSECQSIIAAMSRAGFLEWIAGSALSQKAVILTSGHKYYELCWSRTLVCFDGRISKVTFANPKLPSRSHSACLRAFASCWRTLPTKMLKDAQRHNHPRPPGFEPSRPSPLRTGSLGGWSLGALLCCRSLGWRLERLQQLLLAELLHPQHAEMASARKFISSPWTTWQSGQEQGTPCW